MADPTLAADAVATITGSNNPSPSGAAIAAAANAATVSSMNVTIGGVTINLIAMLIFVAIAGLLYMFRSIQKSQRLDFADMITKDGRAVSMTKVLQLIGGVTATWIMIKLTLTGGLSEALFGLYLTYVGAIEGYSKFVAAKYGYQEKSVKEVAAEDSKAADDAASGTIDPKMKPPGE